MSGSLLGFSPPANVPQVLTVPFGCHTPGLAHTCTVPTLVDAAACASPTMHIVREWLENGAKAVVVSLHATKIWNAGEGAFVAFGHSSDRDRFLHMQNFGIYIDADGNRQCSDPYATNGKMSEFSAIAALASRNNFHAEYDRREEIVRRLQDICVSKEIDYIPSHQSFWIAPNQTWQKTVALFDAFDVETRNYYWDTEITPHSNLCQRGVCLPTHDERIIDIFDKKVSELICD
jgi:dTDP-4-amino-4,6-dideoxygalactose transaminase